MNNQGNRIPENKTDNVTTWKAPEITDGQIVQTEKLKERGPRGEIVNVAKDAVIYTKMTAAQLEEITIQAYEDIHDKAYKKGFEQGQQEGQVKGLAEADKILKQQLEELKSTTNDLLNNIAGQDNEIEKALVNVAVSIAKSVLRRELVLDSSHMHSIVSEAVAKLPFDAENITVFLSTQNLQMLTEHGNIPEEWNLRSDPSLTAGGCRVVTKQSAVEFTLEDQFQQTVNHIVEERYEQIDLENKQLNG